MVDLLIEERLDELREISIQAELCEYEAFEVQPEDEAILVSYGLKPCRSLELLGVGASIQASSKLTANS